jgi:hypothetical protein
MPLTAVPVRMAGQELLLLVELLPPVITLIAAVPRLMESFT